MLSGSKEFRDFDYKKTFLKFNKNEEKKYRNNSRSYNFMKGMKIYGSLSDSYQEVSIDVANGNTKMIITEVGKLKQR